jgi:hypothetical protein
MKTIFAVAALFLVAACQSGGGYDGPYPFQPVWTQPQPVYQPMYRQPVTCSRLGNFINCY